MEIGSSHFTSCPSRIARMEVELSWPVQAVPWGVDRLSTLTTSFPSRSSVRSRIRSDFGSVAASLARSMSASSFIPGRFQSALSGSAKSMLPVAEIVPRSEMR